MYLSDAELSIETSGFMILPATAVKINYVITLKCYYSVLYRYV